MHSSHKIKYNNIFIHNIHFYNEKILDIYLYRTIHEYYFHINLLNKEFFFKCYLRFHYS